LNQTAQLIVTLQDLQLIEGAVFLASQATEVMVEGMTETYCVHGVMGRRCVSEGAMRFIYGLAFGYAEEERSVDALDPPEMPVYYTSCLKYRVN
jgi:hypothetical protein